MPISPPPSGRAAPQRSWEPPAPHVSRADPAGSRGARRRRASSRPDRRRASASGLTAPGVAVLLTLVTGLALAVDLLVSNSLGWVFGIGFTIGCGWVALRVRTSDRLAALVAPPLVFAVAVLLADQVVGGSSPGHFPFRQMLDLGTSLSDGAPMLVLGCAVAGAVLLVRQRRDQRP